MTFKITKFLTYFRFNLNEGIKEAQDVANTNKQDLDKMLEEEREDRNNQSADLLDKIDKEKRDRASGLADITHKFEDDNEHLSNKLHERMGEVIKNEEKARSLEVSKINQDIDDLHEAILSKIKDTNADLEDKILQQEKKENDKFLDFAKTVNDDNKGLKKFLEDEKDILQSRLEQETKDRIDEIDKMNDIIAQEHQNNLKIENKIKDFNDAIESEKKEREGLQDSLDKRFDDGMKIFNDNLNSMEEGIKADLKKEHDLMLENSAELDNMKISILADHNNLLNKVNQETLDRNEENAKINERINQEAEQGSKLGVAVKDLDVAVNKGKENLEKIDASFSKKLEDNIGVINDKISQVNNDFSDKLLKETNQRAKEKEELRNGLNQINESIKDDFGNEVKGLKLLLEKEKDQRIVENNILREKLDDQNGNMKELVGQESAKLKESLDGIKKDLESANNDNDQEILTIKAALNEEIQTRSEENELLNGTFGTKLEDLQRHTKILEDIVDAENAVRKQEALELKERLEREKQQLQEYIEKDNAALRDKLEKENNIIKEKIHRENEQRKKENEDLESKLQKENQNMQAKLEGESKLLKDKLDQENRNLHQQLEVENNAREALKKQLEQDKQNLAEKIERENQQIRDRLKEETEGLANKLEGETNTLKENMEKEKQDAKKEQERLEEEMNKGKMTLGERLRAENAELQERMKREEQERAKKEAQMKEEMKKSREGNKSEILELFERMKKELEDQKLKGEELEKRVKNENDKRMEESKRIQKSRLKDKQKLLDYIEHNSELTDNNLLANLSKPDVSSHNPTRQILDNKNKRINEDNLNTISTNKNYGSDTFNSNNALQKPQNSNNSFVECGNEEDLSLSVGILQVRTFFVFTSRVPV